MTGGGCWLQELCSMISDKYDTKPGRVKTSATNNYARWWRWDVDINAQLGGSMLDIHPVAADDDHHKYLIFQCSEQ